MAPRALLLLLLGVLQPSPVRTQFFGKRRAGSPFEAPASNAKPGGHSIKPRTYTTAASQLRVYEDANNCIKIGGGLIPEYYVCQGCQTDEAMKCVEDLRLNISGNVPVGCRSILSTNCTARKEGAMTCESVVRSGVTTLSDDFYADECCALFDGDGAQSINRKTSAYPDALLCLTQIGCIDSPIGKALQAECEYNCGKPDASAFGISDAADTAAFMADADGRRSAAEFEFGCQPTDNAATSRRGGGGWWSGLAMPMVAMAAVVLQL